MMAGAGKIEGRQQGLGTPFVLTKSFRLLTGWVRDVTVSRLCKG